MRLARVDGEAKEWEMVEYRMSRGSVEYEMVAGNACYNTVVYCICHRHIHLMRIGSNSSYLVCFGTVRCPRPSDGVYDGYSCAYDDARQGESTRPSSSWL